MREHFVTECSAKEKAKEIIFILLKIMTFREKKETDIKPCILINTYNSSKRFMKKKIPYYMDCSWRFSILFCKSSTVHYSNFKNQQWL